MAFLCRWMDLKFVIMDTQTVYLLNKIEGKLKNIISLGFQNHAARSSPGDKCYSLQNTAGKCIEPNKTYSSWRALLPFLCHMFSSGLVTVKYGGETDITWIWYAKARVIFRCMNTDLNLYLALGILYIFSRSIALVKYSLNVQLLAHGTQRKELYLS